MSTIIISFPDLRRTASIYIKTWSTSRFYFGIDNKWLIRLCHYCNYLILNTFRFQIVPACSALVGGIHIHFTYSFKALVPSYYSGQLSSYLLYYSFIIIINCILIFSFNEIQYSVQCPTQRDLYYEENNYCTIF